MVIEDYIFFQMMERAEKLRRMGMHKFSKESRKGEGDRRIFDAKPKHLFAGKRPNGKTDRR